LHTACATGGITCRHTTVTRRRNDNGNCSRFPVPAEFTAGRSAIGQPLETPYAVAGLMETVRIRLSCAVSVGDALYRLRRDPGSEGMRGSHARNHDSRIELQ
jgi:hypothetical protein